MASPTLDQFRAFLDHFDAEDRTEVLAFFRFMSAFEENVLQELGPRVLKPASGRGLRRITLEGAFYHCWPAWLPFLGKVLRHEADLEIFEAGARVLGRIPTPEAKALLRELHGIRQAEAFQAVLGHVLAESDPREAFAYHFGRLLEGSASPRIANEAAAELVRVVSLEDLPQLLLAVQHPDLLVARHALRLVAHVNATEAAEFLLAHLQESHAATLADRRLREDHGFFRGTTLPSRTDVLSRLQEVFGASRPEALAILAAEMDGLGAAGTAALQTLKEAASDEADRFLVEAAALLLEGKPAKLATLAAEAMEGLNRRGRRMGFAVDACAEGLGSMVRHRIMPSESILPALAAAYRDGTGREGLAHVLGQFVSPKDGQTLALIMAGKDSAARGAALEAIGQRREEDLLLFLLEACRDPIVDLAQRAMVSLGQLGGAPGTVLRLVLSSHPEEARLGIRIAGINRMEGAASVLLELLGKELREDLALEAIQALGSIGLAESGDALLDLLHTGQSARVQVAMAQAVRDMGHPDLAFSLCARAAQLRNVQVSVTAAEALIRAFPDVEHPMPPGAFTLFWEQVKTCWEDKEPWGVRSRLVEGLEGCWCEEPAAYDRLVGLIQGTLADKRVQSMWSLEQQNRAASVAKELSRRQGGRR